MQSPDLIYVGRHRSRELLPRAMSSTSVSAPPIAMRLMVASRGWPYPADSTAVCGVEKFRNLPGVVAPRCHRACPGASDLPAEVVVPSLLFAEPQHRLPSERAEQHPSNAAPRIPVERKLKLPPFGHREEVLALHARTQRLHIRHTDEQREDEQNALPESSGSPS
jgi:hypothetical protein